MSSARQKEISLDNKILLFTEALGWTGAWVWITFPDTPLTLFLPMRDLSSPIVMGLLVAVVLVTAFSVASASDILPQASAQPSDRCPDSVVESQETLSALGIDFGAAELLRYTELDLNGRQKKRALNVVSDCRPAIDRLCDRMTDALRMDESTAQAKAVKKAELEAIVKRFQRGPVRDYFGSPRTDHARSACEAAGDQTA